MASAARGTSSSRCSRSASRARCRSSACTRRADVERLRERVDALSEAVNELIKASGCAGTRIAGCKTARARASARSDARREAGSTTKPAPRRASARSDGASASQATRARRAGGPFVSRRRASLAVELVDLLDVVGHRVVLAHALELGPRVVLRAADEIEAARPVALDVAVGGLLVVRVELEQRRVVGLLLGLLRRRGGGFELRLEIVLLVRRPWRLLLRASSRAVSCYFSANANARNAKRRSPAMPRRRSAKDVRGRHRVAAHGPAAEPHDDLRRADVPRDGSRSRACAR